MYLWFLFSLVFVAGWIFFYIKHPSLRHPMRIIGLLIVPTTIFQFFYMKDYWNPPSIVPSLQQYGIDIESALWTFFSPGISLATYGYLSSRTSYRPRWKMIIYLYLLGLSGYLIGTVLGFNSIYAAIVGMIFGIIGGNALLKINYQAGLKSISIFFVFYLGCFCLLNLIDPSYVPTFWKTQNVSGIFILAIPLEEIFFGVCAGTFYVFFSDALLSR
ncbi:MAG: hypothetical protein J0L93_02735 [Deltaproteobacteria bacterium]|nr:hypothetical protein [Deltaproteobacteria bacterium]